MKGKERRSRNQETRERSPSKGKETQTREENERKRLIKTCKALCGWACRIGNKWIGCEKCDEY